MFRLQWISRNCFFLAIDCPKLFFLCNFSYQNPAVGHNSLRSTFQSDHRGLCNFGSIPFISKWWSSISLCHFPVFAFSRLEFSWNLLFWGTEKKKRRDFSTFILLNLFSKSRVFKYFIAWLNWYSFCYFGTVFSLNGGMLECQKFSQTLFSDFNLHSNFEKRHLFFSMVLVKKQREWFEPFLFNGGRKKL